MHIRCIVPNKIDFNVSYQGCGYYVRPFYMEFLQQFGYENHLSMSEFHLYNTAPSSSIMS